MDTQEYSPTHNVIDDRTTLGRPSVLLDWEREYAVFVFDILYPFRSVSYRSPSIMYAVSTQRVNSSGQMLTVGLVVLDGPMRVDLIKDMFPDGELLALYELAGTEVEHQMDILDPAKSSNGVFREYFHRSTSFGIPCDGTQHAVVKDKSL